MNELDLKKRKQGKYKRKNRVEEPKEEKEV
jgi:hypothetical protein